MQDSKEILNAVLVGIPTQQVSDFENLNSLAELSRLVNTLGHRVIGQMSQRRSSQRGATVLGDGKLKELAQWTGGTGKIAPMVVRKKTKAALKFDSNKEDEEFEDEIDEEIVSEDEIQNFDESGKQNLAEKADLVIFDCDLSPSQLRNLESATGAQVLDRTGVIIEIFSRHARTRAARLQVEIARLAYMAPRIRETSGGQDRQGGGIGGKGAGESSIELDKRKIRDRMKELRQELGSIGHEDQVRRARREQEQCIALVGYTNAGKSSLMRALTGSEVLVADKLFATLDTTIRPLHPESMPKILVSDTVGFIKKLPHDLVASFKSTLDEALNASLLLYVVDANDPSFRSQLEVTQNVLGEVGAGDTPKFLILNKQDLLSAEDKLKLQQEFPEALFLSTIDPAQVSDLRDKVIAFFEKDMVEEDVLVPYDAKGAVGDLRGTMRVMSESYDERGAIFRVRASKADLDRFHAKYPLPTKKRR